MVDNFDKIRSLLKFENEGDCYYVQLLRRQSDDPMTNGKPDPNYHGNMHSRSIKDYFVPSLDYFDQKKEEMKSLCDTFNVRAYIRLNKRNYQQISFAIMKHITEQLVSGQTFNSPFSLVASAAGNCNCAGKDKTWILDLDEEYVTYKNSIYEMIVECEPFKSEWEQFKLFCSNTALLQNGEWFKNFVKNHFTEIPTKHGIHIISKPFNTATFKANWQAFVDEKCVTPPIPQNKLFGENKTVFSLTDTYLKHVNGFESCLKNSIKNIADITTERLDDNKTIVTIVGAYDSEKLVELWHTYCVQSAYGMKCFDIHKDNPTALYFP